MRFNQISRVFVLLCALFAGAAPALAVPGHAPKARIRLSSEEKAALGRIDDYLNKIKRVVGDFVQLGPQGQIDRGTLYMERPGKIRFSYMPPNPILVVSDGKTVAVANRKLKTVDNYPLSATPLAMLLDDKVDLRRSQSVLKVLSEAGTITVLARTSDNRHVANVRFVFAAPEIELRQWTVTDDQGLNTTVALNNMHAVDRLSPDLFRLPKKEDFTAPPQPKNKAQSPAGKN